MPKKLFIVESPTKARTIARFLDKESVVQSSVGHVRDLPNSAVDIPKEHKEKPWSRLGIDIDNNFSPLYVIPESKKKNITAIKKHLKDASELYLATDEDREGESISWHLLEVLKPKVPVHRMVFHEITKSAIESALKSPRKVDLRLVSAQEARRILDRLYGFMISPLLWRKVGPSLSAGRVQSVTMRLMVECEKQRMRFVEAVYWDVAAQFKTKQGEEFLANLVRINNKPLAQGNSFDPEKGTLQDDKVLWLKSADIEQLMAKLSQSTWRVESVDRKAVTLNPPPPFITSTLQQEANRKLNMSSAAIMRTAQSLYENGLITYMRTDSTTMSAEATKVTRDSIKKDYGAEHLLEKPRQYKSSTRNPQEAHESIHPSGLSFKTPASLKKELTPAELSLYTLIYQRTLACQMKSARGYQVTMRISDGQHVFQIGGRVIEYKGFLNAYAEDAKSDDAVNLPNLEVGDALEASDFKPLEHRTKPIRRYSEASLIKELERLGIGRPSTYSSIIETVLKRNYAFRHNKNLVPTFLGFAVVQLMERYFGDLVDYRFTAAMEDSLDAIARGECDTQEYLSQFYFGEKSSKGLQNMLEVDIDPREVCSIPLGKDGDDNEVKVRVGRFGPYIECGERRASIDPGIIPDELKLVNAMQELDKQDLADPVLGTDPATGRNVYVKSGRFGPYVQLGEGDDKDRKMKSLLPEQDPQTITLDAALALVNLPRLVGKDEQETEIHADYGRYGAYIKRGSDTRSLSEAQEVFSITVTEALALLAQPKKGFRGQASMLRTLGEHPVSKKELRIMSGRYGPYVTDGSVNATIPRGSEPNDLSLEQATEMIDKKAAQAPKKRTRKR